MFDFNSLFEFSRQYCIAICAFLVPLNLLLTGLTMTFAGLNRSRRQISQTAAIACIPALVMILHVYTWLVIGVVMAPTYILLWLGSTCLCLNLWAIIHPQSMGSLLNLVVSHLKALKRLQNSIGAKNFH